MNPEPLTPLVKRDDDPFERALLRAGQRERAPRGADRRLLAALGVGGGGALAGFLARYTPKMGGKGLLATIAASVAVVGAAGWVVSSSDARAPSANVVPTASATPPAPVPSAAENPIEALPSTRVEDLPSSQLAPKPTTKSPGASPPAAPTATVADGTPNLAREIELVQGARSALGRGDASETLRMLDVHDREFPSGTLGPESRVLRIEALIHAGGDRNIKRANALGDAFLAEHPSGPQARRVRTVLGRSH